MKPRLRTSVPYFLGRVGAVLRFARSRRLPSVFWRRLSFAHRLAPRGSHAVTLESVRRETVQLPPHVLVHTLLREVERVRYVTRSSLGVAAAAPRRPRRLLLPATTHHARSDSLPAALVPTTTATRLRTLVHQVTLPRVVRQLLVAVPHRVESYVLPVSAPTRRPRVYAAPPVPAAARPPRPVSTSAPVRVEPSTGAPLSSALRRTIRRRLGFDPVRVRIHAGESAHRAASELRAAAFTLGEHIYFARGRFDPATPAGRDLLVHELVHVRQQPGGRPFRAEELSPMRLAVLEAEARGGGQPRAAPKRPPLVLAPSAGAAPAVPLLADETSSAVASPTPTEEPPAAAPAAGAAAAAAPAAAAAGPAAPAPPDARQVADEVFKLLERRLRIERERTGVQRWR
jgi:hypothetical protein